LCGLTLVLTTLVGCAGSDVITFSRDSQRKGVALYNEGEYGEAAGAFRYASRQNPRDHRNHYYLGACYEQMGQYQRAIHAYRTARELLARAMPADDDDEFRLRIVNGLGRSIARSDERDVQTNAAVADAEKQGGGRHSADGWFAVAKIYAFRGDADSAIEAYSRAALKAPRDFLIQKDYGLYLIQIGQQQKALAPLRKAYTVNSRDQQVNDALRGMGVVPGPSLKPQSALAEPPVPKGPIPELELKLNARKGSGTAGAAQPTNTATPTGAPHPQQPPPQNPTVDVPRD